MTLKHVKREEEYQSYGSTAQDVLVGLRNLIDLSLHATTIIAAFAKGKHPLSDPLYVQCLSAFILISILCLSDIESVHLRPSCVVQLILPNDCLLFAAHSFFMSKPTSGFVQGDIGSLMMKCYHSLLQNIAIAISLSTSCNKANDYHFRVYYNFALYT